MTPFISNTDFFNYVDSRWVAKNLLDDGTAPTLATMTNTSTPAGARLLVLITCAAEELMSAAAVGARYTENDLRTYGGEMVKQINAGLALGPILERRNRAVTDSKELSATYDRAADRVEQLRRGERIFFAVPNVPEAGLPESASMAPPPLNPPNVAAQAGRYFGCPAASDGYPNRFDGPQPGNGGGCGCSGGGWA